MRLSTLTPTYNQEITALRDRLKAWQFRRVEALMEQHTGKESRDAERPQRQLV